MFISEAFERYISDVIVFRNLSAKTEESYVYANKSFIRAFGDIEISTLTFNHIREWQKKNKTVSPNTLRVYICCLRQVLSHLQALEVKCISPNLIPVPKRDTVAVQYYSKQEIAEIIYSIKRKQGCTKANLVRNKLIISLLYSTGLRVSELCNLNVRDVMEDTISIIGKGNKPRICFVDSRSRKLVDGYLDLRTDQQPWLLMGSGGKRMTSGDVRHLFERIRKDTQFKTIHPHAIRHSYATNLLENGAHIFMLKELMGHSSISSTAVYLHVKNPELKQAYSKYHTIK